MTPHPPHRKTLALCSEVSSESVWWDTGVSILLMSLAFLCFLLFPGVVIQSLRLLCFLKEANKDERMQCTIGYFLR